MRHLLMVEKDPRISPVFHPPLLCRRLASLLLFLLVFEHAVLPFQPTV
jgi:hypothetical protein